MRAVLVLACCLAAACASHAKSGSSSSPDSRPAPPPTGGGSTGTSGGTVTPPAPAADECPSLQIKAPDSLSAGTMLRIQAIATGGNPTFQWTVSAGKIAMGQGTPSIQVDTKGLGGMSVTATVALGNIGSRCEATSASATTLIGS